MITQASLKLRIEAEIESLHDFISAWFRGECAASDDAFADGFTCRLDQNFINIQPSGEVLTRNDLLEPIRAAYGTNSEFRITISDVSVQHIDHDGGMVLATYVEHQSGARNTTPAANARISSVLFRNIAGDDRLLWLHIHETAVRALNEPAS